MKDNKVTKPEDKLPPAWFRSYMEKVGPYGNYILYYFRNIKENVPKNQLLKKNVGTSFNGIPLLSVQG